MLIPFDYIVRKYNLNITGIIHIGAHLAEEALQYSQHKIKHVIWIEANPFIILKLQKTIEKYPQNICINEAVYSEDDIKIKFNITNNGESSSLLNLQTHLIEHPHIYVEKTCDVITKKMSTIIDTYSIDMSTYNFLNLDIQGAELHSLKGFGDQLKHIKYIYTEVNNDYLYENCSLIGEIDLYLLTYGFVRIETKWTSHKWGDALYIKSINL